MSVSSSRVPVAIVGAGPTGLSLALGLARHRVRSVLLEKKVSTSEHSKAPGIHVRTREAFQLWGVEERILDAGVLRDTLRLYSTEPCNRRLLALDFTYLDQEAHRPGLLILEQGRTEKLLLEALLETGMCEVRFGAQAVGLSSNTDQATITVRQDGEDFTVDAGFVVGCDGAGSFVRDALGLPFDGTTYSLEPMLADVRIIDERDAQSWPRLYDGPGGISAAIRLERGVWRILGLEDGGAAGTKGEDSGAQNAESWQGSAVSHDEVAERVAKLLGPGRADVVWASRFRIHLRSAPTFRVGRVLLAGDAAHIHSPAGGQGLNAGVQDAQNLAWKLAYAIGGGDVDRLLDSFSEERRHVVVGDVSRYTDFITRAFIQSPKPVRSIAFFAARTILKVPLLRARVLRRTAMLDLHYPASRLLDSAERSAGIRLPNPVLRSESGTDIRLYELLGTGPVLLDVAEHREFATELPVEKVIRIGPGAFVDSSGLLRRVLGGNDGWILVRPDAHVAWARNSRDGMDDAVRRALGGTLEPESK